MTAPKGTSPWPSPLVRGEAAKLSRPEDDGSLCPWWVAPLGRALSAHRRGGWKVVLGCCPLSGSDIPWRGKRPSLRVPADVAPPQWWRATFPGALLSTSALWNGLCRTDYTHVRVDGRLALTGEAWTHCGGTRAPGYSVRGLTPSVSDYDEYTLLAGAVVVSALAVRCGLRRRCDSALALPRREWNGLLDVLAVVDWSRPTDTPARGSWLVRTLDEILAAADERRRGWAPPPFYFSET